MIKALWSAATGGWYLYAALGVVVLGLVAWGTVEHYSAKAATAMLAVVQAHLDEEARVAENNRKAALALAAHQQQMETVRAGNTAATVTRNTEVNSVVEGITHEPSNNVPAGPGFDALGDRLRKLEADAKR